MKTIIIMKSFCSFRLFDSTIKVRY